MEREPPAWVKVPAHVIALVIVVPVRLLWELLRLLVRGVKWLLHVLFVVPARWFWYSVLVRAARLLHAYLLRPVALAVRWLLVTLIGRPVVYVVSLLRRGLILLGRGLRAVGQWLLHVFVVVPLRFLGSLVWRLLVLCGQGLRTIYRWLRPALIAVSRVILAGLRYAGRLIAAAARFTGRVVFHLVVRPVRWAWRNIAVPIGRAITQACRMIALIAGLVWRGLAAAIRFTGRCLYYLFIWPLKQVWRIFVVPVSRAVGWLCRKIFFGLAWAWSGLTAAGRAVLGVLAVVWRAVLGVLAVVWRAVLGVLAVVWRAVGAMLRAIGRVLFYLFIWPVRWLWLTTAVPAGRAVARAWLKGVVRPWRRARQQVRRARQQVRRTRRQITGSTSSAVRTVVRAFGLGARRRQDPYPREEKTSAPRLNRKDENPGSHTEWT